MIGELTNAIIKECQALLLSTGAQVMLKTQFLNSKIPDYNGTLVLIDIDAAPDSVQYPGGLTRMDWKYGFCSYAYEPDAYTDDPTDYSADLLNFIDQIRRHFTANFGGHLSTIPTIEGTGWLSQEMVDAWDNYGFQLTLGGLTIADNINQTGLIMGYKINMETTALDSQTEYVIDTVELNNINQISNPPF